MYKKKLHSKHEETSRLVFGYTLIELLIVILIMALIFGLGIIRYRDFQRRQILTSAARTLITDLRFAQEKSLAGTKPTGCGTLTGYLLHRTSATGYNIQAMCSPNIIQKNETEVGFAGKHPGITLSAFGDVIFNNLGMGVANSVNITLSLTGTTLTKVVSITQGGEIK